MTALFMRCGKNHVGSRFDAATKIFCDSSESGM
jgi:hypothetical protein